MEKKTYSFEEKLKLRNDFISALLLAGYTQFISPLSRDELDEHYCNNYGTFVLYKPEIRVFVHDYKSVDVCGIDMNAKHYVFEAGDPDMTISLFNPAISVDRDALLNVLTKAERYGQVEPLLARETLRMRLEQM